MRPQPALDRHRSINAKAESFMKTLKVEAVYLMAYETFEDVTADLPRFHRRGLQRSQAPLRAWIPEPGTVRGPTRPVDGQTRSLKPSTPRAHSSGARQQGRAHRLRTDDEGRPVRRSAGRGLNERGYLTRSFRRR